jgi:hypothetical protein
MCCQACGLQWQGFRLLEESNLQLSSESGTCHLGDRTEGVCDPRDSRQRDIR